MEEKEGINIDFYFILWEKYKEVYHSSFGVGLPHTIVYRNQYPIAWFFTNKQDHILKKRNLNLNSDAIFNHLTTKKLTKSDVLAYFIESDPDDFSTKITYFDQPRLREFLDNVNLRPERGVLQQFIDPVGEHNAMYRANWSERTCMISKKINRKNLFTKTLDIYERCCTFEGHHIFSDECPVSGGLLPGVIRSCMEKMFLHIFALSHGNSLFKRADGFFKQDQTGKVWFLWNNSQRIQLKIPEWVEQGATYDQRRPNQLQKDLLCQNCNQLQKHKNFARIAYKYLIQSREVKSKDMPTEKREKKNSEAQFSIVDEHHKSSQTGEGSVSTNTGRLNSQILNDHKEIDDLIDQINHNQREIVDQNEKITIPQIFQIIHPKMTDYTYQSIKDNPKFYSKSFWVCQNCYLKLISYDQLESGCAPQVNYKQILSSYYDFKPKPLRKDFIKFQQECFDLFLEENKYQQTVWQRCTKTGNVEEYQKNKKRLFIQKLEEKEQVDGKRVQQQKQIQKNLSYRRKTEDESSQEHIKLLREKQRRVTDHIDFVISSAQISFLNRPSTSCISFTRPLNPKNYIDSTIDIDPTIPQAILFKNLRRSESNISNKQLVLDDSDVLQNFSFKGFIKKQQNLKERRSKRFSCHLPLHEGLASIRVKNYLNGFDIQENVQKENEQKEYQNDCIKEDLVVAQQNDNKIEQINKEKNENIQQQIKSYLGPDLQQSNLISPTSNNGQVIFYKPDNKQTPIKSQSLTRNSDNKKMNQSQNVKNRFKKKLNYTDSKEAGENDSSIPRPLSSDRIVSRNTFQETGIQFRSKTPSQSIGNRSNYASIFSGSGSNNQSLRNNILDQQVKSYLTSPYQSTQQSPNNGSLLLKTQNKQQHSRSASNMKIKKKNAKQLYADHVNQLLSDQISFNQEYLLQKKLEYSALNPDECHQALDYYGKEQLQANQQISDFKSIENSEQLKDKNNNVDLSKEIEEYGKGEHLENQKLNINPLNNFKKIKLFNQTNIQNKNNQSQQKKQQTKQSGLSSSNFKDNSRSSNILTIKSSFDQNLSNYIINNKNNSNTKSKKQQLIDQLYHKFHNSYIDMVQKNVQTQHQ